VKEGTNCKGEDERPGRLMATYEPAGSGLHMNVSITAVPHLDGVYYPQGCRQCLQLLQVANILCQSDVVTASNHQPSPTAGKLLQYFRQRFDGKANALQQPPGDNQGTSQVLCLSTAYPYEVLSLSSKPEAS
jgi:hypothetical protein